MKAAEAREMSVADLRDRIEIEKSNLDTMKINHAISPLEDTSKIKKTRRDIALMITILLRKKNRTKKADLWKEIFVRKDWV
ncbi:MAG: 50S ribosomal protein L29 [Bacteroidales bacterium]|nr:50S ribosomal protein L29 [Bacteroidales bacterium]